jgi:membrane protease subunit HflC
MRGNGESESNKIYANSFGRDPEFADFYRSMSAYKTAFSNDKTKMIISPDSDFFKYFNNSKN